MKNTPKKIRARVKDIKINRPYKVVEVIVEIRRGDEVWDKIFRIQADKHIPFAQFKQRVAEEVRKDLAIDDVIKDIAGRKTFFDLDLL